MRCFEQTRFLRNDGILLRCVLYPPDFRVRSTQNRILDVLIPKTSISSSSISSSSRSSRNHTRFLRSRGPNGRRRQQREADRWRKEAADLVVLLENERSDQWPALLHPQPPPLPPTQIFNALSSGGKSRTCMSKWRFRTIFSHSFNEDDQKFTFPRNEATFLSSRIWYVGGFHPPCQF